MSRVLNSPARVLVFREPLVKPNTHTSPTDQQASKASLIVDKLLFDKRRKKARRLMVGAILAVDQVTHRVWEIKDRKLRDSLLQFSAEMEYVIDEILKIATGLLLSGFLAGV